jgi:hypothetical protein
MTETRGTYDVQEEEHEERKEEKQTKKRKGKAVSPYEGCYVKALRDRTFYLVQDGRRHKLIHSYNVDQSLPVHEIPRAEVEAIPLAGAESVL